MIIYLNGAPGDPHARTPYEWGNDATPPAIIWVAMVRPPAHLMRLPQHIEVEYIRPSLDLEYSATGKTRTVPTSAR